MILRIIDFQELTTHYKNYQDGVEFINNRKQDFLNKVEPLKKEMNTIISENQSPDTPENKKIKSAERFHTLQQEAIGFENEFKYELKKLNDDLNVKCYDELAEIIKDWSLESKIDVVIGKMEVVFNKPEFESTDEILEILKQKGLYVENKEND